MELPSIPEAYTKASRELSRLFNAGELTPENYAPLRDQALKAIEGMAYSGMLVEGIALFDPSAE